MAASPDRTPEQTAVALVSAARGYHRREDKPFWWAHFDRLNYPVDEWSDETDVFIVDEAKVAVDWHKPPRAQKLQRRLQLTGELARGALNSDRRLRALRAAGPVRLDRQPRPTRGRPCQGDGGRRSERADRGGRLRANPGRRQHLSPAAVRADARRADRDQAAARGHRSGGGRGRGGAAATPPHRGGSTSCCADRPGLAAAPTFPEAATPIDDITAALLDLDSSYVAVHGPPGTGKTYTAARVIARLVADHGWRIGVVAQSHAVVENLLDCTIEAGIDPLRVAKKKSDRHDVRVAADQRERLRRIHQRHTRMRDRRNGLGLRQPGPGSAGQPGPAGDRRGRPVLPGQHDRGGRGGGQPAAARRPAAAAAGQPGHSSRAGRRVRAGLAGRRPPHPAHRTRLLPGPHPSHASRGVRAGVGAGLRGPAAAVQRSHRGASARRISARGAGASRSPRGQLDREPRRSRRHRRPDPTRWSARTGRPSTAPGL